MKWEYKIARKAQCDQAFLTAMGLEGWELCGVTERCPDTNIYYFKRLIQEK